LYTLARLGFAAGDDKRHFVLQPRVLSLGYSYISSTPLARAAQPTLDRLSGAVHESCSVAVLEAGDIVYIARANVTRIMSVHLGIGSRLPAFCTSMGRVLLAHLSESDLGPYLSHLKFKRYTDRTLTSVEKLRQALRTVRKNAFAIVDQELELGLRSMAVPIFNLNGKVVAALNVGTHAQRISMQEMQIQFLPHLRQAAQELSMLLK
ncbi:MAG: IclR family transcriptional regulator domain-containing protein, partial [Chloroflexota bacterium]